MTCNNTDLARRAVACSNWKWKRGMRTTSGILCGGDNLVPFGYEDSDAVVMDKAGEWLPDLDDPATIGCLLALVREAWGDPSVSCTMTFGGWWRVLVMLPDRLVTHYYGPTEAAALVAALEAAPC